ncbi:hypothetical protein [Salibacterium aidingense]|uniref:hypothetical protein n=1 Tax=Salibacterium aidingense TaxID=384933 RepID=UPI003BC2B722
MQQNPRLTEMLVRKLLRKYNVDPSSIEVSEEDRQMLQGIIQQIEEEVNQFLENQQVSENSNTEN